MKIQHQQTVTRVERELVGVDRAFAYYQYRVNNRVGESLSWDPESETLSWIDVRGAKLLQLRKTDRQVTQWLMPKVIGATCRTSSQEMIVALKDELRVFDPRSNLSRHVAAPEQDRNSNRLNEGRVSPCGKWFLFGSMDDSGERRRTGAIYAMDREGKVKRIHDNLFIANGFAFTLDGLEFLFSDSFLGVVYRSKWDPETGTISDIHEWLRSGEEQGRPDGAMIDRTGRYWSAGVSAGKINVFDKDGALAQEILMPCHAPTMICGAKKGNFFVTSLIRPEWPNDFLNQHDGALLELETHKEIEADHPPAFNLS